MNIVSVKELVKKAEKKYLKHMAQYDWFKESERPYKPALKAYVKLNVFKSNNVEFNPQTRVATSYRWWQFVKPIGGKLVFNNYRYSVTTYGHQSAVRNLLSELGIKIDFTFEVPKGLQDLESAILHYENKIKSLLELIQKPGTRKAKNKERTLEIKSHLKTIKVIKSLIKSEK